MIRKPTIRKRRTMDPAFYDWWARETASSEFSEPLNQVAASKVWQGALEDYGEGFDHWWTTQVVAGASCFPIRLQDARRVWNLAKSQ